MTIEIGLLLSVLSVGFAIYVGLSNKKRSDSDSVKKDAIEAATVNVKLDMISKGIDDIKIDMKSTNNEVSEIKTQIVEIQQSVKSAHHRIDDLKGEK